MSQIEPKPLSDDPQLNEHLWQAWQYRNRELDKLSAAKRLGLLKALLAAVVVFAIIQNWVL